MNTRLHTLKNTLFSSLGVYTEFALGMLTSIIIARQLGPENFGVYSALVWLVGLGIVMTNSGTASTLIKFIAEVRGAGQETLLQPLVRGLRRTQNGYLLVVLAIGAVAVWLLDARMDSPVPRGWMIAFFVFCVSLRAAYMLDIGIAKGMENFRATAIVALLASPVNLLLILLVAWLGLPLGWYLGVFAVVSIVFVLASRAQVRKLMPPGMASAPPIPEQMLGRLRHQVFYNTLIVSAGFLSASEVEVILLNAWADPAAAGQFKVAYQLAFGAASLVPGVFAALMLPMMTNALHRDRARAGQRFAASTSYLALLAFPLAAAGMVFGEPLVRLLYGAQYAPAASLFWMFLLCACGVQLAAAASGLLIGADRQKRIFVLLALCLLLKFALGSLFIHRWGLHGAVASFAIVAAVNVVVYLVMAARECGTGLEWALLARVALASLLATLASWWPLSALSGAWGLVLAALVFCMAYALLTALFGCWSREDIQTIDDLLRRRLRLRGGMLDGTLRWAASRAMARESA